MTVDPAWEALGSVPLLYEEFVPFDYEVSIIGVRARSRRHRASIRSIATITSTASCA